MRRILPLASALLMLPACDGGGEGTGPPRGPTFQNIAGTYRAEIFSRTGEGAELDALVALMVEQTFGNLSGTWDLDGNLADGLNAQDVAEGGPFTGTITSGPAAIVSIRLGNECAGYGATFSGRLNSSLITLLGELDILADCVVVHTFPVVLEFSR